MRRGRDHGDGDEIDEDVRATKREINEGPDPFDITADADDDSEPCPSCGKPIHEQAEWCHHCGHYLSRKETQRGPGWIFWTTAGLVALTVIGLLLSR